MAASPRPYVPVVHRVSYVGGPLARRKWDLTRSGRRGLRARTEGTGRGLVGGRPRKKRRRRRDALQVRAGWRTRGRQVRCRGARPTSLPPSARARDARGFEPVVSWPLHRRTAPSAGFTTASLGLRDRYETMAGSALWALAPAKSGSTTWPRSGSCVLTIRVPLLLDQ